MSSEHILRATARQRLGARRRGIADVQRAYLNRRRRARDPGDAARRPGGRGLPRHRRRQRCGRTQGRRRRAARPHLPRHLDGAHGRPRDACRDQAPPPRRARRDDLRARHEQPFVEVNCAAIPEELIESELFGHEKGAFTGALARRRGKFELADGGTLFLDEIGDMSLKTQAKVLRALEEQAFERVGGKDTVRVDVRVITASNRDLETLIREGRFREDLYYRLNVIPIEVPALRARKDDIPMLVDHFVALFCAENGKRSKTMSGEALGYFLAYDWPGNVRELRNMVERPATFWSKPFPGLLRSSP